MLDTHEAVKELKAAGASEPLAEAIVATAAKTVGADVATKTDIAEVRTEIAEVRTEVAGVRTEIAELRAYVNRALWVQAAGIIGVLAALKLLP